MIKTSNAKQTEKREELKRLKTSMLQILIEYYTCLDNNESKIMDILMQDDEIE